MASIWKFGSDVDTDQIVPGRYAPYMRPDADVGEAAFIEARPDLPKTPSPAILSWPPTILAAALRANMRSKR